MILQSTTSALPDPLPAPQIVGSAPNQITMDPTNASIAYSGAARPTRRIPGIRFSSTASGAVDANGTHKWSFSSVSATTLWLSFGPLPAWVDTSENIILKAAVYVATGLSSPNDVVRFFSRISSQRNGVSSSIDSGEIVDFSFDTGGGYSASTVTVVSLRTRSGSSLQANDIVTVSIQRAATATEDTVGSDLVLCDAAWLEVIQKETA